MGGLGSGNWYRWPTRPVVEEGLALDINWLIRHQHIHPGTWSRGTFKWSVAGNGEQVASVGYEADLTDPESAWMRFTTSMETHTRTTRFS